MCCSRIFKIAVIIHMFKFYGLEASIETKRFKRRLSLIINHSGSNKAVERVEEIIKTKGCIATRKLSNSNETGKSTLMTMMNKILDLESKLIIKPKKLADLKAYKFQASYRAKSLRNFDRFEDLKSSTFIVNFESDVTNYKGILYYTDCIISIKKSMFTMKKIENELEKLHKSQLHIFYELIAIKQGYIKSNDKNVYTLNLQSKVLALVQYFEHNSGVIKVLISERTKFKKYLLKLLKIVKDRNKNSVLEEEEREIEKKRKEELKEELQTIAENMEARKHICNMNSQISEIDEFINNY